MKPRFLSLLAAWLAVATIPAEAQNPSALSTAEAIALSDAFEFTSAQALRMNRDFFSPWQNRGTLNRHRIAGQAGEAESGEIGKSIASPRISRSVTPPANAHDALAAARSVRLTKQISFLRSLPTPA